MLSRNTNEFCVTCIPKTSKILKKLAQMIVELSEYTRILYEFDNPNFVDFRSDLKFIFKQLIPWTFKFLNAMRKMNQFEDPNGRVSG